MSSGKDGHIRNPDFGVPTRKSDPLLIDRCLKILRWLHDNRVHDLPNPLDRHYSLLQGYRNEYGLIDSERLTVREMGVISVSDKIRGLNMLHPMARRMREYKIYEVGKFYCLSLIEFLHLPRYMIDYILQDLQNDLIIAEEHRRAEERKRATVEAQLKQQQTSQMLNGITDLRVPGRN